MIFFSGDHHFGHDNILRYCNRPFEAVEEMNGALIQRWNSVVGPYDTVYYHGDFTLGGYYTAKDYFSKLNGTIRVLRIPFHHDKRWIGHRSGLGKIRTKTGGTVELIAPLYILEFLYLSDTEYPKTIVLSHFAMRTWPRKHYGSWHLYGHSHGKLDTSNELAMDIGVDCWGFYPVSLDTVVDEMRYREANSGSKYL